MNIKLKKRNQVTIPNDVSKAFNLKEGDILDLKIIDGVIVLQPMDLVKRDMQELDEELNKFKSQDYKKYKTGTELLKDV
ncbi:MAG TPA: AbrB/MazE/SpoVT family DNA-binding domain-containing protein [Methanobacterium sp.]|nr:AbrB/MazE/SpoVT family DNA-binding domain-containing protein [Methanobacterium sp.]